MVQIPAIPRTPIVDKDGNMDRIWQRWFIDFQQDILDPLGGITASRIVASDTGSRLTSVTNLAVWIAGTTDKITVTDDGDGTITLTIPNTYLPNAVLGTTDEITVTDNGDGTVTLSMAGAFLPTGVLGTANEIDITDNGDGTITISIVDPLAVNKGGTGVATLTDHGLLLGSGTADITPLAEASNGQLPIGSTGNDPVLAALTGTTNQVAVANAAGSITLSTPQDIDTDADVEFDRVTVDQELVLDASAVTNITAVGGITVTDPTMNVQGSGSAVIVTADPQISVGVSDGQILVLKGSDDTNTVELNTGTGLHLHGKAILTDNDAIVLTWDANDNVWKEVSRNFDVVEKSWAFKSPSGAAGTFYYAGYYNFAGTHNDFSPSVNFGIANASYDAHVFVVLGAQTVDELTIRVTGTSITDAGVRSAGDTQDIVIPNSTVVNTYYETSKKWIGQVAIAVVSGTAKDCNYGFSKYWDHHNTEFRIMGVEVTWLGGANDATPNFGIRHHKATGWTYNAGAVPTPPAFIADMNTDHNTEIQVVNGENGAWKHSGLNTAISGSGSEGVIIEVVTSANKAFDLGNVLLNIRAS